MPLDTSIALGVQNPQFQTIDPMTIYNAMQERQMNALRAQALQQTMAQNALTMQNTMEDRRAAAAKVARDLREQQEMLRVLQGGRIPARDVVMGPGTIQASTPAGYDFEGVKNKMLERGKLSGYEALSKAQEQEANRLKAQRAAETESATGAKVRAETKGFDLKNIDTRLATIKSLAPLVDTDQGAAAFSKLVTQIVPEFAGIAGDPDEAAARNAAAFAKDPEAWRTQVSNLTAEQLVQAKERAKAAAQPKPTQLSQGGMLVDENPQSPTYKQVIARGAPTAAQEKAAIQNKQLEGSLSTAISTLEDLVKPDSLLDKATASGFGAARDFAYNLVGAAGEGQIAGSRLKVLADPILKMVPRFEGPQSDKDTQSYKEAAGQLGDERLPAAVRKAAAETLLTLFKKRRDQFTSADLPEAVTGTAAASTANKSVFDAADAILGGK